MAGDLRTKICGVLNMERQGRLVQSRRGFFVWLFGGLLLIGCSQGAIYKSSYGVQRDAPYQITASSGLQDESRFVYFYHFLGYYPVATMRADALLEPTRAGAQRELAQHGASLRTEIGHTTRYGDLGKVWLYFPDLMLRGYRGDLSARPASVIAFVLALMLVYTSACLARLPIFGLALVLAVGSNPFQISEVYMRDNVFGWPIIALLLVLAVNLPLIAGNSRTGWRWAAPLLTALLMATVRQLRSEPALILGAVGVVYLFLPGLRWRTRVGLTILLLAGFIGVSAAWTAYFLHKIRQADEVTARHGSRPYPGPRDLHHMVWHPIWCGLGDFGDAKGYVWDDRAAARFALPILRSRGAIDGLELKGKNYNFNAYWDQERHYYRTPYEVPGYNDVIREKVIGDITSHPIWYAGILAKRSLRVLTDTSPVRLTLGSYWIPLPIYGWMLLPAVGILIWARSFKPLLLIAVAASTSLTALIVYSGGNITMYSSYHLVLAALLIAWGGEVWLGRRGEAAAGHAISSATDKRQNNIAGEA